LLRGSRVTTGRLPRISSDTRPKASSFNNLEFSACIPGGHASEYPVCLSARTTRECSGLALGSICKEYSNGRTTNSMAKNPGLFSTDSGDRTGEYFTTSTPLHAVRPGYVRRSADDALYEALRQGRHAHIIAPNRSGKSSLIAATSARLQNNGFKVAVLDLAQIRDRDGGSDAARWYYSIAYRLLRQLRLKIDLQDWWQDKSILSNRQRVVEFYAEVILQHIDDPVVLIVDEIQCVADNPLAEHLIASNYPAYREHV